MYRIALLTSELLKPAVLLLLLLCCCWPCAACPGGQHPLNPPRDGRGAGPSLAVWNDDLVRLDPDWIIICPCGLDMQETVRELPPGKQLLYMFVVAEGAQVKQ